MIKTVLITGGSRGIGAAAVRRFSSAGYNVAFTYKSSAPAAAALSQECGALTLQADAAVRDEVFYAVASAEHEFGRIDILINNAGIAGSRLFTDITEDELTEMFRVNVGGAFFAAQAVLPGMIHRKSGCIINISSIWGIVGASCEVHYSAAKAALIGMTHALAREVGPSGIRVNCIAPGVIDTDMNAALDEVALSALREQTPLGRIGTPEEIADCMFYLASDGAGFITGQVISPNGGIVI